jgi:hypothetical protein
VIVEIGVLMRKKNAIRCRGPSNVSSAGPPAGGCLTWDVGGVFIKTRKRTQQLLDGVTVSLVSPGAQVELLSWFLCAGVAAGEGVGRQEWLAQGQDVPLPEME